MALTIRSTTPSSQMIPKDIKTESQLTTTTISYTTTTSHMKKPPTVRASRAYSVTPTTKEAERLLGPLSHGHVDGSSSTTTVPVFVMLPLDTVGMNGRLNRAKALNASLMALKGAGVDGVMVDAWWGLVEKEGPLKYEWEAYHELVVMVAKHGLKLQVVLSFHQCGGNVGDSCSIPLPPWVLEEMSRNPDIVYTDRSGRRNPEYISLGCDSVPVLRGRTPIQCYTDFMRSFRERFHDYLGNVIVEIQVGMGPCGELRYPSYPESNGTWRFPGIGEFQCYDKYMKASLRAAAEAVGQKEWGHSGPHDSGNYNQFPEDTGFFHHDGTWNTDYGRFFLGWYSGLLLHHCDLVMSAATSVFHTTGAALSVKVAGIHWHYNTRSHPAELNAGYYNTRARDGYLPLARAISRHGAVLNFTCMEMRDREQEGARAGCSPEGLVRQVSAAAREAGAGLAGENALERYDSGAFGRVVEAAREGGLCGFTYLRMNKRLFEEGNWREFVTFVRGMKEMGRLSSEEHCGRSDLYVGFIKKDRNSKTAAVAAAVH